ncbi:hypothetical protein Esti_002699 [Eimeria stiedai]
MACGVSGQTCVLCAGMCATQTGLSELQQPFASSKSHTSYLRVYNDMGDYLVGKCVDKVLPRGTSGRRVLQARVCSGVGVQTSKGAREVLEQHALLFPHISAAHNASIASLQGKLAFSRPLFWNLFWLWNFRYPEHSTCGASRHCAVPVGPTRAVDFLSSAALHPWLSGRNERNLGFGKGVVAGVLSRSQTTACCFFWQKNEVISNSIHRCGPWRPPGSRSQGLSCCRVPTAARLSICCPYSLSSRDYETSSCGNLIPHYLLALPSAAAPLTMGPDGSVPFWVRLKWLLPGSDHPAALQPTPFGLNRYVLLATYILFVAVSSCDYLGWGPLSSMLLRSGAYLWQCSPDELRNVEQVLAEGGYACTEQDLSVQGLFSCCYASHFITFAISGFLLDFTGPKVSALLGSLLSLSSWVLLGACSESFRAWYPAFTMMGAGSGMVYLPMLSIVNLFPGSFGFSLTMLGAGASLSLTVPSLLNSISMSGIPFRWVCWIYALFGPFVGFLLVSLFVPLEGFIEVDLFVLVTSMRSHRSSVVPANAQQQQLPAAAASTGSGSFSDRRLSSLPCLKAEKPDATENRNAALSTVTDEDYFLPFRKEACTFLYLGICIYFTICSCMIGYYQQAAHLFLTKEGVSALEVASPLSTIPCLVLGRLWAKTLATDYVPIVYVMIFSNAMGVMAFLLANIHNAVAGFSSITFFAIYLSIFTTQVFIFTKSLFTSVHFGKLAGIACMVGGFFSLFGQLLYNNLTVKTLRGNCAPVLWALFGVLLAAFFLLVPMARAANRKQTELRSQKVLLTSSTSVKKAAECSCPRCRQATGLSFNRPSLLVATGGPLVHWSTDQKPDN